MLRPYSDKGPFNLVDPWVIFGKDARIVTIFTPIMSSQEVIMAEGTAPVSIAEQIYGSLISLGLENKKPVKVIINSPGGDITAGFLIIQGIEHLKAKGIEVWTVNLCKSASMGGIILMMGTKGKRYTLGDTLIHTHFGIRHSGGTTAEDVEETHKFTERINNRIYELMSNNTSIPEFHLKRTELPIANPEAVKSDPALRIKLIKQFLGQNVLMSPEEAKVAGMIDEILLPGNPIIDEIYRKTETMGDGQ